MILLVFTLLSLSTSCNEFTHFHAHEFIIEDCTLALETSGEGCAKIRHEIGIRISDDTVIRLLLKRYEAQPSSVVGDVIGIDEFAYKKRQIYGTIIVNEKDHEPITLLEGHDGETLWVWLKENKHIWVITRDRASAYAKVIVAELPDVVQIAEEPAA